jgi:hypothetical protein
VIVSVMLLMCHLKSPSGRPHRHGYGVSHHCKVKGSYRLWRGNAD